MKNTISIKDFTFESVGNGLYNVTYTSPYTGIKWTRLILIDIKKYTENPKIKDLNYLKEYCKENN